ncbi:hypothetical protein [Rhodanobacter thiooxydans]|uniref:hypothetical protein n=1 Tax=Rhodanobacter thiooxydans TaxID=416169 RepID=UPI000260C8F0|nr:hypothetical protein [Rhodanobacter thiooxydans]EIL98587.1 hypothetical protein UUA_11208 [Rhodanobacter thiooxydans LCS2]MCW0201396.1 hypothetical protein [Rhodanobacter thiooxydans]
MTLLVSFLLVPASALAASPMPAEIAHAKSVFADAQGVSARDAGRLWGLPLYGRMLLVIPATRAVIANQPDPRHLLRSSDGVYVGTLPNDVVLSDAPTEWEGVRWTQLRLPALPQDAMTRSVTLAHEMFHRIQPELHIAANATANPQLDAEQGRLWLRLEWRALAAALIESGPAQVQTIRDALTFRDHRQALFPGSAATEAAMEIVEGTAQYTGIVVAEPDVAAARWHAAADLIHPDAEISFSRLSAFMSGPAYGRLLDERMPGWRKTLNEHSDLGAMLASTLHDAAQESAESRAAAYGASGLRVVLADRAAREKALQAQYRAALVDGPTLSLTALGRFNFNPSTAVALGANGMVYSTFHAIARWGTLDVSAGGVLVSPDFSRAALSAPTVTQGAHLEGKGWTIDLAPGWSVAPATKPGNYVLVQHPR